MDNSVLRTQLSILSTFTAYEAGSVLGAALLLAAHRARESDDRTVLSAPPSPCTSCVVGRYEQSVRSTVVEAADQAATSSLEKKG